MNTIPETFEYVRFSDLLTRKGLPVLAEQRLNRDGSYRIENGDAANILEILYEASHTVYGLMTLGYEYGGFNGTNSADWIISTSPGRLNIYAPGEDPHTGRITLIMDNEENEPSCWTDVRTGVTHPKRVALPRRNLLGRNFSSATPDQDVYIPGVAVWSQTFASQPEFIATLREADTLMRDVDTLTALTALL
jgi:hypothetical protein